MAASGQRMSERPFRWRRPVEPKQAIAAYRGQPHVVERGTLRELVTAGGLFTRLHSLQHRSAIAAVADGE